MNQGPSVKSLSGARIEDAEHRYSVIIVAETAEECIANIAKLGDLPAGPGEKFIYASTNLFVLSYALQNYTRSREGGQTNYWDLVRENMLIPIGAENFSAQHTQ